MGSETIHFLEAVLIDTVVMVSPEHVRLVMESYSAADASAETNASVTLPLSNFSLAKMHGLKHWVHNEES